MAKNPDPEIVLSTLKGTARTVDDWTTMFHLCLVVLPDRPEAAAWVPVAQEIFRVLGDSDCRTAFVVPGNAMIAERILEDAVDRVMVLLDPDKAFVKSIGLEHLPAFVHLRQDTSIGAVAEGWDPAAWQKVAEEVADDMSWSRPDIPSLRAPAPTAGWAV